MSKRRILSLWFPRLAAERALRVARGALEGPLAVVEERGNAQQIAALDAVAEAAGLWVGQPLRDAHALCAGLATRPRDPAGEAAVLAALRRWAGKFSPWVAGEAPDGLILDLTGCTHLFGGEPALLEQVEADCAAMGLSLRAGLADTPGAAWALARFAGQVAGSGRSGDAIDQEARATRARAGKRRHWTRGGAAPAVAAVGGGTRIAPPGKTYGALSPLPVAALRLEPEVVAQLNRLGLRRIGDLLGQPRAGLARRFGKGLVHRLDQAMGSAPEPVSPARPERRFAVRLTLPEPIGLKDDLLAGIDRMLPRLCAGLEAAGQGARQLRLEAHRTDRATEVVIVGLARPGHDPDRIRPLLELKLDGIDAGFGIDMLRLEAVQVEPIHARTATGHMQAGQAVRDRLVGGAALDDLLGRLGARVGMEAITRRHPAASHIPEKTAQVLAAAWSEPAAGWPAPPTPRPLLLWPPEPVIAPDAPELPAAFRWRGRDRTPAAATGPERIAPEWWLDEPAWRSGVRDYWAVTTRDGDRLWLFYAHGAALSPGWFCQGQFA
ncbi:Y-family DNA polymerase [Antarcticimicrobium luteum]|uniref:DNA polymerase Y family protein n=1 Tax=Antarcticimicrobium luteum TaxID=2547397 RepID=A0A4R5V5J7_9RHOB|nr:DNA polymerase Y family protein [Antarcticimicrobium luteum]TDK46825.1 DNA polymerase Y family protein [Antarcticimicrobium luteum]